MPYRNQETVASWVRDYLEDRNVDASSVSVLEKEFTPGPDSGLVVVALSNASTVDRKSTRLNSSHIQKSRMPSSA